MSRYVEFKQYAKHFQKLDYRLKIENHFSIIMRGESLIFPPVYDDIDVLSSLWRAIEFMD